MGVGEVVKKCVKVVAEDARKCGGFRNNVRNMVVLVQDKLNQPRNLASIT